MIHKIHGVVRGGAVREMSRLKGQVGINQIKRAIPGRGAAMSLRVSSRQGSCVSWAFEGKQSLDYGNI